MRVIFVGLHNKPNTKPLCPSTKSGKLISRIINEGGFEMTFKTNLFDVEYFPADREERVNLAFNWLKRVEPQEDDVLVLLGQLVHNNMPPHSSNELRIAHPASKRSHAAMNEYVQTTIKQINSIMTDTQVQVLEGCKLIAGFMGMKHTKTVFDSHGYEQYNYTMPDELSKQVYGYVGAECFLEDQFSKSWDWLMTVAEKIEGLDKYSVEINKYGCAIKYNDFFNGKYILSVENTTTKIEAVWQAVIDFIKWHNQTK